MVAYHFNTNYSSGFDFFKLFGHFSRSSGGFSDVLQNASIPESLVLDSEKGELVKVPVRMGKKEAPQTKAMAALKSHSEAERRRRERINTHLDTLRNLVPCTDKMDKATLLGEVISQVKQLKKAAVQSSEGFMIPMDTDEVTVEAHEDLSFRASLCCEYRPQLLTDLRRALDALQRLQLVKAEISTLGGRLKNVFVFTCRDSGHSVVDDADEDCQVLVSSIHQALKSVLEKDSAFPEYYSPTTTFPNKRQRISYFGSSSTSFS